MGQLKTKMIEGKIPVNETESERALKKIKSSNTYNLPTISANNKAKVARTSAHSPDLQASEDARQAVEYQFKQGGQGGQYRLSEPVHSED
jgi:hypothetical protein